MTNAQKITVWVAAINAAEFATFGVRLLVAQDVAKALGLCFQFDEKGFELRNRFGRVLKKTTADFVLAA